MKKETNVKCSCNQDLRIVKIYTFGFGFGFDHYDCICRNEDCVYFDEKFEANSISDIVNVIVKRKTCSCGEKFLMCYTDDTHTKKEYFCDNGSCSYHGIRYSPFKMSFINLLLI